MAKSNHGYWYLISFPVILFILFGLLKIHSLSGDNKSIRASIHSNDKTVQALKKEENGTTLADYERQVAGQGADLYQKMPQADRKIKDAIGATYGKVSSQNDLDKTRPSIEKLVPGSFTTTLLDNGKPQASQAELHPTSPFASLRDVNVTNRFSDYNQGNVYIWTDVAYTVPSRTVTNGRKITVPSSREHDYYLLSYHVNENRFDSLDNTHSQTERGDD